MPRWVQPSPHNGDANFSRAFPPLVVLRNTVEVHTCHVTSAHACPVLIPTQVMDVAIYQHHSCIRKLAVMYGGYESNTEVRQGRARSSALLMDVAAKMEQGIA